MSRHGTLPALQNAGARANPAAQAIRAGFGGVGGNRPGLVHAISEIGLPMAFLKFSREFERQADFLGIQHLYAADYGPPGKVQLFERLAALKKLKGSPVASLFQSHPLTRAPVRPAQKKIDELLPDKPQYNVAGADIEAVQARLASLSN